MTPVFLDDINVLYKEILSVCVTLPPRPTRYINFFEPFHFFTAGDQLVVPIGVTFLYRYIKYNRGNMRKKNKLTNTWG